ncbi:Swarming motility protein SwrC [compost metagenome]|uniref:efflux RND transporter permease subunit n=1 Tax=Paenibacillus stellifer TaxID=169760 RepID=UPI00068AD8E7|nr:efflux RND transporter permease subunit [Paenibacillus stellifer]
MNACIRFSMKNVGVIFLIMLAVLAGGIYSTQSMRLEQLPNVDIPYLYVTIPYPGATPQRSLDDIGKPLESAMQDLPNLKNVYTFAGSNYLALTLEFEMGQSMDEAIKNVNGVIASTTLPGEAQKAIIDKAGPGATPIYSFAVSANQDPAVIKQYVQSSIEPSLSAIHGIDQIEINGSADKKISVRVDESKLQQEHLNLDTVKQMLLANNLSIPAGQMNDQDQTLNVEAGSQIGSLTELEQLPLLASGPADAGSAKPYHTVKLKDIAAISYSAGNNETMARLNGKQAIIINIKSQPGSNTVEIAKQVNRSLTSLSLPAGYKIEKLRDNSVLIKKSVEGMLREVLLGTLFAVIVTFVFLRNIRATLVAILSIPISVLATMIMINALGFTFNIMTLAGVAVAVGRVVDDSIVVIENIYRRLNIETMRTWDLIVTATTEVGQAVTSSTITTIAVFGPLSFVPGIVGKFFAPFGVTVIIALAFSLIVSVTVVPLLARLFLLKTKPLSHAKETGLQRVYRGVLTWSLSHKLAILLISVALFGSSVILVPNIPMNFLPNEKTVSYGLDITLPAGNSLDKSNEVAKEVENDLKAMPIVQSYQTNVGSESVNISIELDTDASKNDIKSFEDDVRQKTSALGEGIQTALTQEGLTSGSGNLALVVKGSDAKTLQGASEQILGAIKNVPHLADVASNLQATRHELSIQVDPDKAAEQGLNPALVAAKVRSQLDGDTIGKITLDGQPTDLLLGLNNKDYSQINRIGSLPVTNIVNQQVAIGDVARIEQVSVVSTIQRQNQVEFVMITGHMTSEDTAAIQNEVKSRIEALKLPGNVSYSFEGDSKEMNEGFQNMAIAMAIAILLVYSVMMVTFGEMLAPLAILFSLPFIFTGGIFGLFITNEALGMPALVGFLMLIGIVVTNAIVYLDRVIHNRKNGIEPFEALLEAGTTRIRPILMTAIATLGALIPLAVSTDGGLVSKSLAIVVISGLTTSTLLTLVVVPVAYLSLDRLRSRLLKNHPVQQQGIEAVPKLQ